LDWSWEVTVAELIEKLQSFPPETRVLRDDYEQGSDDIVEIKVEKGTSTYRKGEMWVVIS
jgi:hypothetical protein